MTISAFDLYKVGIGPSSSHTVGPMRAAHSFVTRLESDGLLADTARVRAEMFGSLGATGHGHGTVKAVVLGLEGEQPDRIDPTVAEPRVATVRASGVLRLGGKHEIAFALDDDVVLHRRKRLPFHTNGMLFAALDGGGQTLLDREYYSVGGGFVLDQDEAGRPVIVENPTPVRYPFTTAGQLLQRARETGLSISEIMLANELSWRSEDDVRSGLLHIWSVMHPGSAAACERKGADEGCELGKRGLA
jgi:L-serine dehydratase